VRVHLRCTRGAHSSALALMHSHMRRVCATPQSLRDAGRKLMLLTNSDFPFVDVGLRHILRDQLACPAEWTRLFDVVVVGAQRPAWFTQDTPFRSLNTHTRARTCSVAAACSFMHRVL
jgi:hypothetical protein